MAAAGTLFASGDAVSAYGLQGRPARDFSGVPKAEGATADPTIEAAARQRASDEAAKKTLETSARFGTQTEPPANKAQEKLAKAREQAQARAQRR